MSGLVAYDSPSPAASASIVPSRAGTPSVGVAAAVAGAQAAATAFQGTSNVATGSSALLVSSGESTDRTVPPPSSDAQRGANRQKFEVELEFIQALASPKYLHELARSRVLYEEAFINFLDYLEYWRQPRYAKFLIYPSCLRYLTLLRNPEFRDHLAYMEVTDTLINDSEILWNTWRESESTRLQREAFEASQMDIARRQADEEAERKHAAEHARHAMEAAKKTAVAAAGAGGTAAAGVGGGTTGVGGGKKGEGGKGKMKDKSPEATSPKTLQHGRNFSV